MSYIVIDERLELPTHQSELLMGDDVVLLTADESLMDGELLITMRYSLLVVDDERIKSLMSYSSIHDEPSH